MTLCTILRYFVSFTFMAVLFYNCKGQWIDESLVAILDKSFHNEYNLDCNLINGKKYYNWYSKARGYPYFMKDEFEEGRIVVNGISYNNLSLRYDLINQQIVLLFTYLYGGNNQIILKSENITEFEIYGKLFKRYAFPETDYMFFQVLVEDKITCLYHWEKKLILQLSTLDNPYHYTEQNSKSFLLINDQLIEYKGKKSFTKIFPGELHKDIKRYIKSNDIRLNSSDESAIIRLIRYCSQISDLSKFDIGK